MAEPKGAIYLRAGGTERFKKDTSKRFALRINKTLVAIDKHLPQYAAIPRDERTQRTGALLALIALCDKWLSDKQIKIDQNESFRAAAVSDLHVAALAELRGLQNWAKAKSAFQKLIPKSSMKRNATAPMPGQPGVAAKDPVRLMQEDNWLEVLDKNHRRGQELKKHFRSWQLSSETISFWEYLEKLSPADHQELAKVSVRYVDDLVLRTLFEVSFESGLMRSRMSPVVQAMILSKMSRERVFQNGDDKLLDTSNWPSSALRGLSTGWAAFVLSPQNVLYAGIHAGGTFHHSSFLSGAPVLASGMIKVKDGRILGIHEKNGHYQSQAVHLMTFLRFLYRKLPGTDWENVEYINFDGTTTDVAAKLNLPRKPVLQSRPPGLSPMPRQGHVRREAARINNS